MRLFLLVVFALTTVIWWVTFAGRMLGNTDGYSPRSESFALAALWTLIFLEKLSEFLEESLQKASAK